MSKFKDKNEQILEKGRRDRALRTPDPNSLPARWYNAYVKENPSARNVPENFCHYYRIVLFWFPLSVVLDKIFFTVVGRLLALSAYAALAAWLLTGGGTDDTTPVVIGACMIGLPYFGLGVLANVDHYDRINPEYDNGYLFSDEKRKLVRIVVFPVTLISMAIFKLSTEKKDASLKFMRGVGYVAVAALSAVILWMLGLLIYEVFTQYSWWTVVKNILVYGGVSILFLGSLFLFLIGMGFLKERIEAKLDAAKRKRPMITINDPDFGELEVRAPSKLKKFLMGAGDLGLVIINVIRTRKWKICPIMDVQEAPDVRTKR